MNEKLQVILSQPRSRLEQIYGDRLVKMILFGSQARSDAKPDSDIDVLVVLKGEVNPGEEIEKTGNIVAELSLNSDLAPPSCCENRGPKSLFFPRVGIASPY